ncbi:MAG: glycosyltransferase family A protein [Litorilinea sp.]
MTSPVSPKPVRAMPIYAEGNPFFSVVICTFNRAPLLPRALDSLLAQVERDWEAIVVDDGSQDNTAQIMRDYTARHAQIRYMYHSNRGLSISRNVGIFAAGGRYVTFLDSDDAFAPEHLHIRREILEADPSIDLLHGGCKLIGNPYVPDKHDPTRMLHLADLIVGGTFVMPTEKLIAVGGFPLDAYSQDSYLYENVEARGMKIVKTDAPTYIYDRTSPDSMCNIVAAGGMDALEAYQRTGQVGTPASA